MIAWNEVLRVGYNASREAAWWRSPEATVAQFQSPKPGRTSVALWAIADDLPVGAAEAHVDPDEPAEVEISVIQDRRREGIGRALAGAVREALAGAAGVVQAETYCIEGVEFARAHGMAVGNQEWRQLLDLPVPPQRLVELGQPSVGVEIRSWCGPCPDELVDDWATLVTRMDADVPMGELTRTSAATNVATVRQNEQRTRDHGNLLVRSLAQVDGKSVGYTEMFASLHGSQVVSQDDTFVDRGYRCRGIGRAMKVANLSNLMSIPEAQSARWVQTYTAVANTPMLALNKALGFRVADMMTVLEGRAV
ncbi:MAG: hypothetical protein QM714_03995 [Nocardioides sp.]|uniref:GNAT family N-acetyltransferase n=1 Tax=Nocardioides sp. TaxID=35761 RepID=UPI0039E61FF3